MNEKTQQFLGWVEQSAFKLAAEGKNPTALDSIKYALIEEWIWGLAEVAPALVTLETLEADLALPEKVKPEDGGSAVRYWGRFIGYEKPYPTVPEMIEAHNRGLKRFEVAMSQPIPDGWTWDYTPPDTFLARFPEQVYIGWGNHPGKVRFWMTAYDGELQMNTLRAGQKISPPWYAHESHVGYGDVSYGFARGERVEVGRGEQRNRADFKFVCPTPKELYEHLKAGGTVKSLIRERLGLRFE